jgi:hypothetical protein
VTVVTGLALAMPGVASARGGPKITNPPSIAGKAVAGETLTAVDATWQSSRPATATFRWVRCGTDGWSDCALIPGSEGVSYTLADADVGHRVLVWLQVATKAGQQDPPRFCRDRDECADSVSEPTAAVAARPKPVPPPTPSPSPSPQPAGPPPADIVPPDTTTPAPPAGDVAGQQADALKWLSPFPIVRIKGWLTASGARVTMLTVRAPRGARISVRCTGAGCPRKRYARMTRLVHLKPYQRLLRGSLRLQISVTRKGYVGKRTIITMRKGKAPKRRDLCLYPGVRRAKSCEAP